MNWLFLTIPNVAALLFLVLAFRLAHKEKYGAFWYVCLIAAGAFLCGQPWFQGLAKTWIVSNVNSKLKAIGQQIDDVQKTTAEMHSQLSSNQTQIEIHQQELGAQQVTVRKTQSEVAAQEADMTNHYAQLLSMQTNLVTAQTSLMAQQKQIQDVGYLVNALYSEAFDETFGGSDTNKVAIQDLGSAKRVAFMLKYSPVPYTISAMARDGGFVNQAPLFPQMQQTKNLVFTYFYSPMDVKAMKFYFRYIKNIRETNLFHTMEIRDTNILYLDGVRAEFP